MLALVVGAMLAGPAAALRIEDITPLYFEGVDGQGFSASAALAVGRRAGVLATPEDLWIPASGSLGGQPVVIDQQLGEVHQGPSAPSREDPVIVDSTWTVTNLGAGSLQAPLLVLTSVDPLGSYPGDPDLGLDADLLELVAYSYAGVDYLYGAVALPDLTEGESASVTMRYVAAEGLIQVGETRQLPPIGVAVLGSYVAVPEPGALLLLGLGLAGLAKFGLRGGEATECVSSRHSSRS